MAGTTTTNSATATWTEYPSTVVIPDSSIHVISAGLTITNTGTTPVNVGGTGTFTITATNNGPDTANNIQITDPTPAGYTAGTPTTGTYNNTTGIWTITSLANGGIATLTFNAPITATMAGTTTTNTATAKWTEYPTTTTIPNSTIYVKQANVAINQTGKYSGNNVTFIVTATNNGPDTATYINIKDLIPSGLTGVIVTPSIGSYNSTTGIWTINSLLNGSSATLNITGTATPINTIYNNATKINQTEYDPYAPETTKIGVYVPSVKMYVMQYPWYYDTVNGYENTYSYNTYPIFVVDVENWGNDDATGVTVNYTLGTGFQYITSNTGGMGTATYNPTTRTVTWNIGNMPTTGTALMMVDTQAITTGNQTPALTNTATLTHVDQYDTPNNYKTANYSINVPKNADIQVNQTQTTSTQGSNKYVTYTINATNNGPDNATGLQITDTLPTGLTWISDNSQGTYNPTTGIWNIGTLNNGNNIILTIKALITGTGTIVNTAQTTAEDQQDWNSNNNAQTLDLTITGTYTPNTNMYVLQYPWYYDTALGYVNTYSYNTYPVFVVDVENWGNDDATGVTVNYTLGTGYQYITTNTGGIGTATYNPTTRTITWNIGNMPTTGTALMMVVTQTTQIGNQTTALTNTATLTHIDQNDTPNNYKTQNYSIIVPDNADIQVNQTQTTTTQNNKTYVTYTINTTNNGPDNATGLQITDTLPTGLTWISDNSQGTYNPTTGIWNIGTLNNNTNTTITITAQITGTGNITNTAQTTTENQQDWNSNNNAQTTTTEKPQ
jgi:uncharacterized repeat protein (TIGR01451 family)